MILFSLSCSSSLRRVLPFCVHLLFVVAEVPPSPSPITSSSSAEAVDRSRRSGRQTPRPEECGDVYLDMMVSPYLNRTVNNVLEIFWESRTVLPGDWVGLFDHDPSTSLVNPLFSATVENRTGFVSTGILEGKNSTLEKVYHSQCYRFWAAYVRSDSGEVGAVTCLSTEPRWMENSWNEISKLSLANCFLPGTHNSAAFKEYYAPFTENLIEKYTYNQELSVLDQLIWGVRVLDLRIAHYANNAEVFWCNHDVFRLRPLKEVLHQVKLFLNNTKEIVVLDLHNFPVGFRIRGSERHAELIEFLEQEMGAYLAPASLGWGASLEEIRESGRRAVISYNSKGVSAPFLWPPVMHKWGDVQTLDLMERYFISVFRMPVTAPWAAMVELTPRAVDLILDRLGGLRNSAVKTNPLVTLWFRGQWGGLCHIVSVDFVRSTSIVKTAIDRNRIRAGYLTCATRSLPRATSR